MKRIEADVVVIAGGMSGLSAAIAAAEKDVGVIVLEKGSTTGGAANMGMGMFAVGSHIQRDNMIDFTPDEAFSCFMEYTHWRGDARLVRKYYDLSGNTIEWLEHMGVEFLGAYKYFNQSYPTWHIVKVPGSDRPSQRCASVMIKAMTDYAVDLGVDFHFNTPAKKIIVENGRVTGVLAADENGGEILAECDAVIVATGGFGDNPEMLKQYTDHTWGEDLFSFRIPGLTGDGIKMAWEAGAARSDVAIEMTYNSPGISNFYKTISEVMRQPNLLVNYQGKRIFNEQYMNNTVYTGNVLDRQFKRSGFSIIDDSILDYYRRNGLDYITWQHNVRTIENWDTEIEQFLKGADRSSMPLSSLQKLDKRQTNSFFIAESIEELAEKAGINPVNLVKTVREYNEACASGDRFFNKDPRFMRPIVGSRFYACRHNPAGYGSLGGIRVDDDLRVMKDDGCEIPGLYACGTDAACMFGDSYCFYMPGTTMGWAINTGRMAGMNVVDYLDMVDAAENR